MLHSFSFWYFSHNGFDTPRAVLRFYKLYRFFLMMATNVGDC